MKRWAILRAVAITLALTSPAAAEVPSVAVSIKPIHSLVSAVMGDLGQPALIVQSTGSEHAYSLRPSDARALETAGLVFWVGPRMESFLEKPLESLAGKATVITLAETPDLELLPYRDGGPFEAHDHDDHDHRAATHSHEADHDDHPSHEEHEHYPAADGRDMHFWLDPVNAGHLVDAIASALSSKDPANAERYAANAAAYRARLDAVHDEITEILSPVREKPIVVFHDAYQYFEKRYGVRTVGSITVNPDVAPGAHRVKEIRQRIADLGAACVFSEPQFEPRIVAVVTEGTPARTGTLDPLGSTLPDGPDLYPHLLTEMARSIKSCLSPTR